MSSLQAQIAEVKREIAMRKHVYPHEVARKKMHPDEAAILISRMVDVLHTLEGLAERQAQEKICHE